MTFFRSLRPINLLIVYVTQLYVYKLHIEPVCGGNCYLLGPYLSLFVITTVIITAGGYFINDYFDHFVDKSNGKLNKLSPIGSLAAYLVLTFIGFAIAMYIALSLGKIWWMWIYVLSVVVLYLYSMLFKKMPLVGNLVVSLFTAGSIVIFILIENLPGQDIYSHSRQKVYFLSSLVFFISMIREIIKDIEDIKGDKLGGCRTLPILFGIKRSKSVCLFLLAMLFSCLLCYNKSFDVAFPTAALFMLLYFMLAVLALYLLGQLFDSPYFASQLCKVIMLVGMSLILFI